MSVAGVVSCRSTALVPISAKVGTEPVASFDRFSAGLPPEFFSVDASNSPHRLIARARLAGHRAMRAVELCSPWLSFAREGVMKVILAPVHPVDALIEWFGEVHPSDKQDIALVVQPALQGFDLEELGLDQLFETDTRLDTYLRALKEQRPTGVATRLGALAGAIDVYFGDRTTAHDWDELTEFRLSVEREVSASLSPALFEARLEKIRAELMARKERGVDIARSWADLRSMELSPRQLAYWGRNWEHHLRGSE